MKSLPFFFLISLFFLAACSPAAASVPEAATASDPATAVPDQTELAANDTGDWRNPSPQLDEQGAVSVEAVPLNLSDPGETLDFRILLDTHSVDLTMDLTPIATLTTDTGLTIQAMKWNAPSGGHHVQGTLSFPASSGGLSLMDGVSGITLEIDSVDGAVRTFSWER